MRRFKISNKIFEMGLNPQEMSVYVYMSSLPSLQDTLTGEATVSVKQSTIAEKCGIKAVQTVSKVITFLSSKGLVEPVKRSIRKNGHKGTYTYKVKKLPLDKEYFFFERRAFGSLTPNQMMIYLFISKSFSVKLNDCWNSYNDITQQTGMKRETVIRTISELIALKMIVKCRRKSRNNRRVYVDNHYQIIRYIRGHIRKKEMRLYRKYSRTINKSMSRPKTFHYNNTLLRICQGFFKNFFGNRGSP